MAAPIVLVTLLIAVLAAQQATGHAARGPVHSRRRRRKPSRDRRRRPSTARRRRSSPITNCVPAARRCATPRQRDFCRSAARRARSRRASSSSRTRWMASTDPSRRPLTISFNGGPGSSSVWLHLGALGPKRVAMNDDGTMPAPPYRLVDNEATWLDQTDLVFVDPVGTGYSRADQARTGQQVLGRAGRHSVGRRVHPAVRDAIRALDLAAVHGRRKLRHDARGGTGRTSDRPRPRVQRHPAGLLDPQLPDRAVHRRATTCRTCCSCRPTRRRRSTTSGWRRICSATCRRR